MQQSRTITRKSGSNLALGFLLLPKPKRDGMSALYAFCREVDDAADEDSISVETRRERLAEWREDVRRACAGATPRLAVNVELQPVIERYHLPFEHFDELIKGVEMDLDINRYQTFGDLELYCYRVASVVGLLSIEIFGYRESACKEYAVHLGKALQLTNILRDVRVDSERGQIYLPLTELARFGVTEKGNSSDPNTPSVSFSSPSLSHLARARLLSKGPCGVATRRPPFNGGRRVDGLGILAAARQTRKPALQRIRTKADASDEKSETVVDLPSLVSLRFGSYVPQLWDLSRRLPLPSRVD